MSDPKPPTEQPQPAISAEVQNKLADLDELGQQVRRRIRSNQRFLERFLDEDFVDDEDLPEEDDSEEQEEL